MKCKICGCSKWSHRYVECSCHKCKNFQAEDVNENWIKDIVKKSKQKKGHDEMDRICDCRSKSCPFCENQSQVKKHGKLTTKTQHPTSDNPDTPEAVISEKTSGTQTLSDKIIEDKDFYMHDWINVSDLKQSIKKLKSKRNNGDFVHWRDVEKEFGEKLV